MNIIALNAHTRDGDDYEHKETIAVFETKELAFKNSYEYISEYILEKHGDKKSEVHLFLERIRETYSEFADQKKDLMISGILQKYTEIADTHITWRLGEIEYIHL